MNREDSSEYLLLNAYHKSVKERPDSQLQIGKDAAQTSSTVRPPKPPHKSHSDVQLLKQAAHLAGFVISSGKHYACVVLRSWNYSWTAETCSFAFSLLTFTGLVTMLLVHQNRPIPEWPQIVSINSIVSLFALFMRTGVGLVLAEGISQSKWQFYRKPRSLSDIEYFDLASRSPWGAVLMLCNLKPRSAYLIASLGALATVMTSLTGFFSQQLVQFETCQQRDYGAAVTVAKTNNYTAHGVFINNYTADGYSPMVAAINVGLIQPVDDLSSVLVNGCMSGNCTFPSTDGASISTVGIGHVCKDISAYIGQDNRLIILNSTRISSPLTIEETTKTVLVTAVTAIVDVPSFSMADIAMLYRQRWDSEEFAAIQCSLFPTVNTYGINITNSIMNEHLVESIPMLRHGMRHPSAITQDRNDNHTFTHKMATPHTFRNGSREACTGTKDSVSGRVKVFMQENDTSLDQPVNASTPDVAMYYPADCVWAFGMGASSGIRHSLQTMFHNQTLVWGGRWNTDGSVHLRALFQPGKMSREDRDAHLEGNISFESVNNILGNLTRAMTAVVRSNGYERFHGQDWSAYGDMWYTTTCVYVRWKWITFPVFMLGLTGAFLLLVTIENRDVESDRLWKSSVLAALFCEVDIRQNAPAGKDSMREFAESTSVSLEGESTGALRLIAH